MATLRETVEQLQSDHGWSDGALGRLVLVWIEDHEKEDGPRKLVEYLAAVAQTESEQDEAEDADDADDADDDEEG
jgi:hypothetical protein